MIEPAIVLRAARPADATDVARIWHEGWPDGHLGHVPADLVAVRTEESFRMRAADRIADTVIAAVEGMVAGFTMIISDEVEQLYVATAYRGTGVADVLLTAAEARIQAGGHARAWLAVVDGNTRARRFYERRGWVDEGAFVYAAEGPDGPIHVPARRYAKNLT